MKKALQVLAASLALTSIGAGAQSVPSISANSSVNKDAIAQNPTTVRSRKSTALNPAGLDYSPILISRQSNSPKEYGQYLQRTRKQKWNRKSK